MATGITKTLEVVMCLRDAALDMVEIYKALPFNFLKIGEFISVATKVGADVQAIVADEPFLLPELRDLDITEAGQLASAVYEAVSDVIVALKA